MLAALATLLFLATIWLVAVNGAEMLRESAGKVLAALKGRSVLATAPAITPITLRVSQRSRQRVLRAQPQLRSVQRAAA